MITYRKIAYDTWGIQSPAPLTAGDTVTVQTRSGNAKQETVGQAAGFQYGNYIYAIVPHRSALASDASRPLTSIQEMVQWQTQPSPESIKNHRGHNTVFSPRLLFEIQEWYNRAHKAQLVVEEFQLWDDKIKLGHAIVYKVHKVVSQVA